MKADTTFLLERAAWPAFIVETSGTIRHANQAAIGMFGPKLEGESVSLSAIWEEVEETPEQFLARWERTALPVVRLRFRGKGGSVVSFRTHVCPTWEAQRRYLFQLVAEPVAEPTASESQGGAAGVPVVVGDAVHVHKQKLAGALHLARTVSLEFNNVLTSITAHTSLLLGLAERGHPWRTALVEVEKAAHKAAEITHQLAMFSRQEKDGGGRQAANLNTLLRRVVETFNQSRPTRVTWSVVLDPQLNSAKFDEPKLHQAFIKILENSVEATNATGEISVTSSNLEVVGLLRDGSAELAPGSYVRVEIADNGPGISPSVLPRIFDPFFTTKAGHRGLGLAWVYGIVTNHRGAVAVSSWAGHGASTRVYLPATRQRVADSDSQLAELRGDQTVLMVDDEELLLTMGHVVLGSFGYRVLTANSGAKALEVLERVGQPVDLVIVDLVMPQMSGREFSEQIQLRLPGVPVLFVSGLTRGDGGDDESFLPKPFTSQELLTRVRQILVPRPQDPSP